MKPMTTLGPSVAATLVIGIVFWVAHTPAAQAQQQDEQVALSIAVTDSKGRYISGLQAEDFRIFEDGIVQQIQTFTGTENSYEVTYFPAQNPNQGFRKITIEITSDVGKRYRVRSKAGYRPAPKNKATQI